MELKLITSALKTEEEFNETSYDTNFFDIGACIGSLECFEEDFVQQTIVEDQ